MKLTITVELEYQAGDVLTEPQVFQGLATSLVLQDIYPPAGSHPGDFTRDESTYRITAVELA